MRDEKVGSLNTVNCDVGSNDVRHTVDTRNILILFIICDIATLFYCNGNPKKKPKNITRKEIKFWFV